MALGGGEGGAGDAAGAAGGGEGEGEGGVATALAGGAAGGAESPEMAATEKTREAALQVRTAGEARGRALRKGGG